MKPSLTVIKLAQVVLNERTGAGLKVDGIFGRLSTAAAIKWIPWSFRGGRTWERWVAAVIQKEAATHGINAGAFDAFYGPQTDDAARRLIALRSGIPVGPRPDEYGELGLPGPVKPVACRNPTTAQFRAKYGAEGTQTVRAQCPYPLVLDWDLSTSITSFMCHRLVKDSAEAAMWDVLQLYGLDELRRLGLHRFGGCLYVRPKRGGTTPSVHSWGAAIDWYPSRNPLKGTKATAFFARPEYVPFMDIWARHGWMSLGRCYDFDWQHIQKNP